MEISINEKILLSVKEVAALTSSSESWWRGVLRGDKPLPHGLVVMRQGRCWKISRASLDAWIAAGAPAPVARRRGRPTKAEQQRGR